MKPLFYSDYLEGAHPAILEAMAKANFEQNPGYSEDRHCAEAAAKVRDTFAAPDADVHFLVGGTQTNATVISSILKPYQGVIAASSGHIAVHETGAIEHGGHKVIALPARDGKITAAQIDEAVRLHHSDPSHEHIVQPGMVYISFPTELGTIYTKDEIAAISGVCHEHGIPLFIDGARLGYGLMCPECDLKPEDFPRYADVFYAGGTKQGALFGEAVLICSDALKKDFRYNIKQNGGMLAKGWLLGIQFDTLFTDGLYFKIAANAISQAARIRARLKELGFELFGSSPTNQIFTVLTDAQMAQLDLSAGFEFWEAAGPGRSVIRICTSWATTDEAVETLLCALERL